MAINPINPIDYTTAFERQTPFGGALQAMQAGAQFGVLEQQRAALMQQQMMREQQMQAAQEEQERTNQLARFVDELIANPNSTTADYERVAFLLPKDKSEFLINVSKARTARQQAEDLKFAGQLEAALVGGNPAIAKQMLDERAIAARNKNLLDEAQQYEAFSKVAETSPDALRALVGTLIATLPGGGALLDNISKARNEQRAAEAFVPQQREREAKAKLESLKAEYEPQRFAAEIGLTQAQTAQARAAAVAQAAAARASEASREAARAQADSLAAGVLTPNQRLETETKLRNEYRQATVKFQEIKESYGRILAVQSTPVGDISLVFAFMKMLDPTSVVRDTEYANAENSAGVPERIRNTYNRLKNGERLTDTQRREFKSQAKDFYEMSLQDEAKLRKGIDRIARNYGVNPDNIFIEQQVTPPQPLARRSTESGDVPRLSGTRAASGDKAVPPPPGFKEDRR